MKWAVSILIAVVCVNLESVAQTADYIPIPSDATWEYRCGFWVDLYGTGEQSYEDVKHYYFHLSGDTLINDTAYVLLQEQEEGSSQIHISSAIRQDTLTRKVYSRSLEADEEFLLYDFSIAVADTIYCNPTLNAFSIFPFNNDGAYWATLNGDDWNELDSTSNTLNGFGFSNENTDSHIYYFANYSWGNKAVWAEGIGSLVFLTSPCAYDGEFASCRLVRFCAGDTAWYPWESACDVSLGVRNNSHAKDNNLTAYWDGNSIQIKCESELEQVKLSDILGHEVEFDRLAKIGSSNWKIENPALTASGIYILRYYQSGFIGNIKMFISQF